MTSRRRRQPREDPAVEARSAGSASARRSSFDVRVQDVEAVRVPQLPEEQPHALADRVHREAVAVPRLLGGEEVPAERVGAEAVDDLPRRRRCCPSDFDIFLPSSSRISPRQTTLRKSRLVEEQGRDREQRVEPAARLVERLADEVGGEAAPRTRSSFSNGAWYCANGIAPESNQTSMTSGTRFIARAALRARERRRRRRTGGAGPRAGRRSAPRARRTTPTQWMWPSAQRQTGSGVPQ